MTFLLSYTPRGSRHHPEPQRCRDTDKRGAEMVGGKRGRREGGGSGKQEQRYGEERE